MDNDIKQIRQYCLDRLNEIDELNKSNTLSAFSCYAWLIGVLSHLAYAGQVSKDAKYRNDDHCYKQFVSSFMQQYDPTLMYENFRCGLIHACSFDAVWKGDEEQLEPNTTTKLFVTHNAEFQQMGVPKEIQFKGVKSVIIYHQDLSDSIRDAIEKMFEKSDICQSAREVVRHQRLVAGISTVPPEIIPKFHLSERQGVSDTAQLSGFYEI